MKTVANRLAYLMILTLLACGRGGGSDSYDGSDSREGSASISSIFGTGEDGNGNTTVNSTPIAITQENGVAIASAVLSAIYIVGRRAETIDLVTGSDMAHNTKERINTDVARAGSVDDRGAENFTLNCDAGSISYATSDAKNNGGLDAGDTVSIGFNGCTDTDEEYGSVYTTTGAVTLKINSISADRESMNAAASYTNLVLREDDFTSLINGSMTLEIQTDGDATISMVSGEKINFTDDDATGIFSNFRLRENFNEKTEAWTESNEATMASTEINGGVIIKTITEFQGVGDDYASTGELKIQGANGSFITLKADTGNVNTVSVTIFDGNTTTNKEIKWEDL